MQSAAAFLKELTQGIDMEKELYNSILDDIRSRSTWADRQAIWYQMRRDGLRRKTKPFPGAADMHFPLVDTVIEKFKPFYLNQLFATERLADFISKNPQSGDRITQVAWWFDYKLKQHSNLETKMPFVIDSMLQNGRGIAKITWDTNKKQVCFEAIQPIYIIVPSDAISLQDSDRFVHVQHFSPWRYANGKGSENRNQDAAFIKRITGGQDEESQKLKDAKDRKEGITFSSQKDLIIVWEVYQKTKEGYDVFTVSPYCQDEEVRPKFSIAYKHGLAPFVDFAFEETDESYYAPRGVAEILATFESSLCKIWNEKHDALTFYNRPLFSATRDIPNAGAIKMRPGEILPFEIRAVNLGQPPISWDQEMNSTRMIAEQRISTPDFGIGGMDPSKDNKTATEIEELSANSNQIVGMRSRTFRRGLGEVYFQAWELYKQFDDDLEFIREEQSDKITEEDRAEVVSIRPNGSSDAWNQHGRLKKAFARKQLLGQSPFINQAELDKSILELDEPGLVQRLFRDPGIKEQDQVARIMRDIPALEDGLNVEPRPDDDDAIHASFLMEYMARNAQTGKPVNPLSIQAMQGRLAAHMQRLSQTNPKAARELQAQGRLIAKAIAGQQAGPQPEQGGQPQ